MHEDMVATTLQFFKEVKARPPADTIRRMTPGGLAVRGAQL